MEAVRITARDLGDAWFQSLFTILDKGRVFKVSRGSFQNCKRLEFDWFEVQVKFPSTRPLLPKIEPHFGIPNPVDDNYLDNYLPYLMTGVVKEDESYTYGQRLVRYPININYQTNAKSKELPGVFSNLNNKEKILIKEIEELKDKQIIFFDEEWQCWCVNQMELLIWTYSSKGYRNNQMILQVAHPSDVLLVDPPCLRHIDTRIQDGKLHFFPYFRSWDLYSGFPANLAAIQLMKEYVSESIGVEDGMIIATSKGLHIYDYAFDLAKVLAMKEEKTMEVTD